MNKEVIIAGLGVLAAAGQLAKLVIDKLNENEDGNKSDSSQKRIEGKKR